MPDDDRKPEVTHLTCEYCGREFETHNPDDAVGPDGVVWCPEHKPPY